MANATFELTDGTTTLNLNAAAGSTYRIPKDRGIRFPRPNENLVLAGAKLRDVQTFSRTVQIPLTIEGASVDGLNRAIRDLEKMLSVAAARQIIGDAIDTKVSLTYQMGTAVADDITMEVLHGTFDVPDRSLDDTFLTQTNPLIVSGTLSLLCEPFGRLANVVLFQQTVNPEQDGNSQNFVEIGGNGFNAHVVFNGSSGQIIVSDAAAIQNQFDGGAEISCRVHVFSDGESDTGIIWTKGRIAFQAVSEASGAVKIRLTQVFSGTNGLWDSTSTVVNLNEWYRVGWEYDNGATGNNPTAYVYRESTRTLTILTVGDGLTEVTTPTGTRTSDVGQDFVIGGDGAGAQTADARIDDVRWYGTTGNIETEDKDRELLGTETNLIHYWPMDEGFGVTIKNEHTTATDAGTLTTATWGMDAGIVGDGKAPMRVKVTENGAYASTGNIWLATRSGERRTDALFDAAPDSVTAEEDPTAADGAAFTSGVTGGLTTNASGALSAFMRWTKTSTTIDLENAVVRVGFFTFTQAGATLPQGLFRVLARVSLEHDAANLPGISADAVDLFGFALGYSFGGKVITPADADAVYFKVADIEDQWHIFDLGEIDIPVQGIPESDITPPDLDIRIHGYYDGTPGGTDQIGNGGYIEWACDHIFLLPIDESVILFPDVAAAAPNRVYASAIAESAGAWLLTEADVVDSVPAFSGSPLFAGPEGTRLYGIKDDTGDPSTVSFDIDIEYEPQIRTL